METTTFIPAPDLYTLTQQDVELIGKATNGKNYLTNWLTKRVKDKIIKSEDIYKFGDYFNVFEKNKNKYEQKDIFKLKTTDEVNSFVKKTIEISEENVVYEDIKGQDCYVPQTDIEKLIATKGVKYYGLWKGYQVFEVFGKKEEVWTKYKNILGRVNGRDRGAKIEFCTIAEYDTYKYYLNWNSKNKNTSLFILFNLSDRKSPYQFHFESDQFNDKNNNEDIKAFDTWEFKLWISEKCPKYDKSVWGKKFDIEMPVVELGGYHNKKGKQGTWVEWSDGKLVYLNEYKNGQNHGKQVTYHNNKTWKLISEADYNKIGVVEEISQYIKDKLISQTCFNNKGIKILEKNFVSGGYGTHEFVEYYNNGNLKMVGKKCSSHNYQGKTIEYHEDGETISSMGSYVNNNEHGHWIYFDKRGNVVSEGNYHYGYKTGVWFEVDKNSVGKKIYCECDYGTKKESKYNRNPKYVKVYNKEGKFIREVYDDDFVSESKITHNRWY